MRVENDANCFALSEAIDGSGADFAVVFGIILGTGVGGGIVVNGELVPGRHRIAGEWGHNVLMEDGPACYCGRRGCVETLLSGPGLVAHYCAKIRDSGCDARSVFLSSAGGDPTAHRVVERYLDHFGRAVAGVVNILDPDVIVLGGGLSNAGVLYERGPDFVERYVFSDYFDTPILPGRFGDSSGVRGAARLWPPD